MVTFKVEVKAGWCGSATSSLRIYHDETGGGGGGEDVSKDKVMLGAGESKHARVGHGGTGTRRRSFGDIKRRPRYS